jgi:hypothetical protein
MKVTRRELATVLAPALAIAQSPAAVAQTPAAPPNPAATDADFETARERLKGAGATLAKQVVPMDTEPAFQFKA